MNTKFLRRWFIGLTIALALTANLTYASEFSCFVGSDDTPRCVYSGKISRVFVSLNNLLIYFESPIDLSVPPSVGFNGVTIDTSSSLILDDSNLQFWKSLSAYALSAKLSNSDVTLMFSEAQQDGRLVVDRIWVE